MFTRACHWFLHSVRCIQSTLCHHISLRSSLILSFHLCLDLLSYIFPSGFLTKILNEFILFPICATCLIHFILTWSPLYVVKHTRYEAPHCTVFSASQLFFLALHSDTLSLCSSLIVQDQVSWPYKTSKIIVLHILIFKFLGRTWEDKILNWMVIGSPQNLAWKFFFSVFYLISFTYLFLLGNVAFKRLWQSKVINFWEAIKYP
jgi:hypothetical protein